MSLTPGERIKHWRELRDLKQNELAARAKMDNTKLSRIEAGKLTARVEDVEAIAKALGLTMAEFFGAEEKAS